MGTPLRSRGTAITITTSNRHLRRGSRPRRQNANRTTIMQGMGTQASSRPAATISNIHHRNRSTPGGKTRRPTGIRKISSQATSIGSRSLHLVIALSSEMANTHIFGKAAITICTLPRFGMNISPTISSTSSHNTHNPMHIISRPVSSSQTPTATHTRIRSSSQAAASRTPTPNPR